MPRLKRCYGLNAPSMYRIRVFLMALDGNIRLCSSQGCQRLATLYLSCEAPTTMDFRYVSDSLCPYGTQHRIIDVVLKQ